MKVQFREIIGNYFNRIRGRLFDYSNTKTFLFGTSWENLQPKAIYYCQ